MTTQFKQPHGAWAEIDLRAVKFNFQVAKRLTRQHRLIEREGLTKKVKAARPQVLTILKADAYGHGMVPVARLLNRCGVDYFGVSNIHEGRELREAGIKKPILLLESTLAEDARTVVDYKLTPTVCTLTLANALNNYAKRKRATVDIHIKVDTGMSRLGVVAQKAAEFIRHVQKLPHLKIKGLYTHFPLADTNRTFTQQQINVITKLVDTLDRQGLVIPLVHAANSAGLANFKSGIFTITRPGLMIYGYYPHPSMKRKFVLKPAMCVKARIIFLKEIEKGRGVSYGHAFRAKKKMKVATVPIGYSNGYFRALSNKAQVLVSGHKCPVIGRVTMDQIMVDVTKVKNVRLGQVVTIMGKEKNRIISAEDLAAHAKTINYEVVCSLGKQLPRIYKL